MQKSRTIFLIAVILGCTSFLHALPIERYNTFSYSVNEGLLQSTISDIAFDKHNFCWLSFPNGIQKFDGKNFTTVPVQPGLPDDKLAYFFKCRNEDLLISHPQGISRYDINNNRFTQVYSSGTAAKKPAQFIGEDENIIYFYSANGTITGIDGGSYNTVSEIKTAFPDYTSNGNYQPKISDNIINHRVALLINSTLYIWDLKNRKLLSRSAPIPDISIYFLKLKTESEVLYTRYKVTNALQLYNFTTHTNSMLPLKGKDDKIMSRCNIYTWQNKMLIALNNNIYETDTTLQLKSELVNFKNQPVAGNKACRKHLGFLTGLSLVLTGGLAFSINQFNKRKFQKKLSELESEHKLQLERERISRDLHDNIGAYANAVLYKTDLLEKEEAVIERNELMKDLKFASKDIITSLRETIWALKKEQYTAQDCLLRIRNFIQPFNRYYPHIHFVVEGEAPSMNLHYTKALNVVRIVQEAVSNAIKHANASNINVASSMEDSKWKLVIADDGVGFNYAGIDVLQQGNGLNNMKQRSADAGFDIAIASLQHKGTIITVFV